MWRAVPSQWSIIWVQPGHGEAKSTKTERALCELFAEQFNGVVLQIDDDFFSFGLDSIVAISIVHKARRRGLALSPRMIFTTPTIRELAAAIDAGTGSHTSVENAEYGEVLPLPIVSWVNEYGNYRRFTNSVLLRMPLDVDRSSIELILQLLLDGHDALRSILTETPDGPRLVTRGPGVVRAPDIITRVDMPMPGAEINSIIGREARRLMDEIDPHTGAMVRAVWLAADGHAQMLLLTVHHLVVDVVSWQIILTDIAEASHSLTSGCVPKPLPEFTSYRRWCELMWERATTPEVQLQREFWDAQESGFDPALGTRHPDPTRDTWSTLQLTQSVTPVALTALVLSTLTRKEGMREFLLAATAITIASWRRVRGQDPSCGTLIALDSHGRADDILNTDTTNTVGWFTSAFPVRIGAGTATIDINQAEADPQGAQAFLRGRRRIEA